MIGPTRVGRMACSGSWIKDKTHSWRYQHTTTITFFSHKGETDLKKVSLGVYFIVLASFLEDNRYLNTTGENMHRLDWLLKSTTRRQTSDIYIFIYIIYIFLYIYLKSASYWNLIKSNSWTTICTERKAFTHTHTGEFQHSGWCPWWTGSGSCSAGRHSSTSVCC